MSGAALGEVAIRESLKRAKVEAGDVSEVIMGQILTAAIGMNGARQASINAGVPKDVAGLDRQHGLRLGPAQRGAGRPGDHDG